jgi:hemerythrin-like domain-containing protein
MPHFEMEEKFIYPVLGDQHELIVQALDEHKKLKAYFETKGKDEMTFTALADLLEKHIRFEERKLFNVVQEQATELQLQTISEKSGEEQFKDNEADAFWK